MRASPRDLQNHHQNSQPDQGKRPANEQQVDENRFGAAQEDDEADPSPIDRERDHAGVDEIAFVQSENGDNDRELLDQRKSPGAAKFGRDVFWLRRVLHFTTYTLGVLRPNRAPGFLIENIDCEFAGSFDRAEDRQEQQGSGAGVASGVRGVFRDVCHFARMQNAFFFFNPLFFRAFENVNDFFAAGMNMEAMR